MVVWTVWLFGLQLSNQPKCADLTGERTRVHFNGTKHGRSESTLSKPRSLTEEPEFLKMSYLNCSCCLVLVVEFRMRSSTVSSICTGALKAARLEARHVLAQQPCCQSSCPIKLGMTFKVGRRRRTECPYLLRTSPAVEPLCSVRGWVCLCVLWLWPDLLWHKDSCHISNLSHATQRRCQRPGHQETQGWTQGRVSVHLCVFMSPCVWKSKEDGRCGVVATWKGLTRRHPLTLMSTRAHSSPAFLNPVLKQLSHIPPGLCSKYCFNVQPTPLQYALLVLQSSDPGHFSAHYLALKKSLH